MVLERWDPFRDLLTVQERMNRLFDEALSKTKGADEGLSHGVWSPNVDIYETEENIILRAELPGIDRDDISIEVKEGTLLLKGERKFDKNIKDENYYRMERFYGSFKRSFSLPNTVDREGVKAKFKDGVLEIVLPKAKKTRPKQIRVNVQ